MDVLLRLVKGGLNHLLLDALNNAGVGYKGLLVDTPHLALYKAGPGFAVGNILSAFTLADYDGYANLPVTFGPAGEGAGGRPQSLAPSVLFSPTGATTANAILGVLLVDALVATELWGQGVFAAPIDLAKAADDLEIVPKFAVPLSAADWGLLVTIN